jgi:hypothetical protein
MIGLAAGGALLGGGAQLIGGLPALLRSKAERENAQRLRELEGMGDQLGLTPQERAELTAGYRAQLEATQRAGERQAAGALANGAMGSGAALEMAGQARGVQIAAEREAANQINAIDQQRRTELEGERESRRTFQSNARGARLGALAGVGVGAFEGATAGHLEARGLGRLADSPIPDAAGPGAAALLEPAAALDPVAYEAARKARIAALGPADLARLRVLAAARGLPLTDLPPYAAGR